MNIQTLLLRLTILGKMGQAKYFEENEPQIIKWKYYSWDNHRLFFFFFFFQHSILTF